MTMTMAQRQCIRGACIASGIGGGGGDDDDDDDGGRPAARSRVRSQGACCILARLAAAAQPAVMLYAQSLVFFWGVRAGGAWHASLMRDFLGIGRCRACCMPGSVCVAGRQAEAARRIALGWASTAGLTHFPAGQSEADYRLHVDGMVWRGTLCTHCLDATCGGTISSPFFCIAAWTGQHAVGLTCYAVLRSPCPPCLRG